MRLSTTATRTAAASFLSVASPAVAPDAALAALAAVWPDEASGEALSSLALLSQRLLWLAPLWHTRQSTPATPDVRSSAASPAVAPAVALGALAAALVAALAVVWPGGASGEALSSPVVSPSLRRPRIDTMLATKVLKKTGDLTWPRFQPFV